MFGCSLVLLSISLCDASHINVSSLLHFNEQVDSTAEHDALFDELHVLTFNACHSLLQGHGDKPSTAVVGTLWDAWSTVRGCFKNPLSSRTGKQGLMEAMGFDVQVHQSCTTNGRKYDIMVDGMIQWLMLERYIGWCWNNIMVDRIYG